MSRLTNALAVYIPGKGEGGGGEGEGGRVHLDLTFASGQ